MRNLSELFERDHCWDFTLVLEDPENHKGITAVFTRINFNAEELLPHLLCTRYLMNSKSLEEFNKFR